MGDSTVSQLVSRVLNSGCTPEEACRSSPELLAQVHAELRRIAPYRPADHRLDGDMARLADYVESGGLSAHVPPN